MPGHKLKFEPVVNHPSRGDRILRHDATIPFHFHLEIVPRQDWLTEIENVSKAFRLETMIEILGDVSLQDACFAITEGTAAINKPFRDVPDLGDMEMGRDLLAAWEDKTWKRVRL